MVVEVVVFDKSAGMELMLHYRHKCAATIAGEGGEGLHWFRPSIHICEELKYSYEP